MSAVADVDRRMAELEEPYPLARKFFLRLLPLAIIALAAVVGVVGYAVKMATESAYLTHATRVADNIANDVAKKSPVAWTRLIKGEELSAADLEALVAVFTNEQAEYRLSALKVYDLTGRTLYSSNTDDIGGFERNATLRKVIESGKAGVVRHEEDDGMELFELYVPYANAGRPMAVFELYESVAGGLQKSIENSIWPVVGTLAALLAAGLLMLIPVIRKAQAAITARTSAIIEMRQRLERLVSRQAVTAMRSGELGQGRRNARIDLTLLYSDARNFTQFCEKSEPEHAVAVLNLLISAQVEEIERHGGDIDKIIGDGILARFEGDGRERRAVLAAQALQRRLMVADLPLAVGVGLYSGPVVAGLLGSEGRLDFTIIGDSVNVAARLCAAAHAGEVVVDGATLARADVAGFSGPNSIDVKGREHSISVQRWAVLGQTPALA
ncbi:MAG: adenylate/guanylate cyclase domain-containing protein [Hyphomicrobiaceae bacterium]